MEKAKGFEIMTKNIKLSIKGNHTCMVDIMTKMLEPNV